MIFCPRLDDAQFFPFKHGKEGLIGSQRDDANDEMYEAWRRAVAESDTLSQPAFL